MESSWRRQGDGYERKEVRKSLRQELKKSEYGENACKLSTAVMSSGRSGFCACETK